MRWKGDDIATCDIHEIPDAVHVSRLFTVPKDKLNVRPIFDLSELNSFVVPLKGSQALFHLEWTKKVIVWLRFK